MKLFPRWTLSGTRVNNLLLNLGPNVIFAASYNQNMEDKNKRMKWFACSLAQILAPLIFWSYFMAWPFGCLHCVYCQWSGLFFLFPFLPVSVLGYHGPIFHGAKAPEGCHSSLGLVGPGVYLAILSETQCLATEWVKVLNMHSAQWVSRSIWSSLKETLMLLT